MSKARLIMFQGTASSVGKSMLAAGLCRILRQDGYRVAPFKAQNMSNNSFVTRDGGEMGRAQVVQAQAAGVEPSVDMNPVLLKPEADARSQVIVLGKVQATLSARSYYQRKAELKQVVLDALDRLRSQYDVVVVEGAGSPAEINLRSSDIVNMGLATEVDAPVLLVGDIDRGGVFAHLVGTMELLQPEERALVKGFIINKFRGDVTLLGGALDFLRQRTGVPVLGVVPYLAQHGVPEEDSVVLEQEASSAHAELSVQRALPGESRSPEATWQGVWGVSPQSNFRRVGGWTSDQLRKLPMMKRLLRQGHPVTFQGVIDIAVLRLPRISNFTDFAPLQQEPAVRLRYVDSASDLGAPDVVIIPGTKSTMADLAFLRRRGLDDAVSRLAQQGAIVLGICGGYQMLGDVIRDPQHVESDLDEVPGLGLLPVETVFSPEKSAVQVAAHVAAGEGPLGHAAGTRITGYEIHNGVTLPNGLPPAFRVVRRASAAADDPDGAVSPSGNVIGTYIHGLFDEPRFRHAFLQGVARNRERAGGSAVAGPPAVQLSLDEVYDRWAAHVRRHLDIDRIYEITGLSDVTLPKSANR